MTELVHHERSPLAAVLSYLIPGLGQIYQGRVAKGVLFMVSLLGMFFLGLYMGNWRNVYLPPDPPRTIITFAGRPIELPRPLANLWHRKSFAGQFWIGMAAWPSLWQYFNWNVPTAEQSPFWHNFQRTPTDDELNVMLTASDKTPDLAWIYTVIAGVLNVLVIYDAFAGPAFPPGQGKKPDAAGAAVAAKETAHV